MAKYWTIKNQWKRYTGLSTVFISLSFKTIMVFFYFGNLNISFLSHWKYLNTFWTNEISIGIESKRNLTRIMYKKFQAYNGFQWRHMNCATRQTISRSFYKIYKKDRLCIKYTEEIVHKCNLLLEIAMSKRIYFKKCSFWVKKALSTGFLNPEFRTLSNAFWTLFDLLGLLDVFGIFLANLNHELYYFLCCQVIKMTRENPLIDYDLKIYYADEITKKVWVNNKEQQS